MAQEHECKCGGRREEVKFSDASDANDRINKSSLKIFLKTVIFLLLAWIVLLIFREYSSRTYLIHLLIIGIPIVAFAFLGLSTKLAWNLYIEALANFKDMKEMYIEKAKECEQLKTR